MIKAIETRYAGCRFRSRLEARWAVFFDTLGIRWEYETEGYETPDGWYLPDFLLHLSGKDVWFEVKPENDETADARWRHVAEGTNRRLFVARGLPRPTDLTGTTWDDHIHLEAPAWDNHYAFCVCPFCGAVGIEFEGRGMRICGSDHIDDGKWGPEWDDRQESFRSSDYSRILVAYEGAHSARFEHGRSGLA